MKAYNFWARPILRNGSEAGTTSKQDEDLHQLK
jgi:hypothetical protein